MPDGTLAKETLINKLWPHMLCLSGSKDNITFHSSGNHKDVCTWSLPHNCNHRMHVSGHPSLPGTGSPANKDKKENAATTGHTYLVIRPHQGKERSGGQTRKAKPDYQSNRNIPQLLRISI
eukprot:TRINITY_DN5572_c0_g2_i3.p1 TRINITY_DN5572_c0_g2~~TRINITY_DN5572_c0_g2_i3.p1  ORF type:complete len:121 (-),score=0.05 TRINITY_DN5572_c0_g2_i3:491-853(-)